jgi:hypothetical protein
MNALVSVGSEAWKISSAQTESELVAAMEAEGDFEQPENTVSEAEEEGEYGYWQTEYPDDLDESSMAKKDDNETPEQSTSMVLGWWRKQTLMM